MKKSLLLILILIIFQIILLLHCSTLKELASIQKPTVTLDHVQVTGLTFDDISLKFDIAIDNPNQLSVNLAGFDYDFLLNDQSFIQGQQSDELSIQAQSRSIVELPVDLVFKDIYKSYQNLKNLDSSDYQLKVGLLFDLPVLGQTKIPVSMKGRFPLIKIPTLAIESLHLTNLNLFSANLQLNIRLDNPNSISLLLNKINYKFKVNGIEWISGLNENPQTIEQNAKSILGIPIRLNFMQIGQTAYNLVSGTSSVNYNLDGFLNFGSSGGLIQNQNVTFNQSGTMPIQR
ncbi:MAG: LEA type 2 family protein [Calditrichia bacterium]|nr:LEA type 2 family protein [Calditrichia bacterium]